ncbi:MAG: hypothetical protein KIT87_10825 [Anaerolineae bacterium]|nr:hypothetical protein [Anaerolineae bacterium]
MSSYRFGFSQRQSIVWSRWILVAGLALATGCAGPRVGASPLSGPGSPTVVSVEGNSGGGGDSSSSGQIKEAPVSQPGAVAEPGGLPNQTLPAPANSAPETVTGYPGAQGVAPTNAGAEVPPAYPAPQTAAPANWQVYRNETYKFTVNYPDSYVVVPATAQPQPTPLTQVWFQDKVLARSETANLQPPQFAVDVYTLPAGQSLDDWLKTQPRADQYARQPVQVGSVAGVRLVSELLMAPNEFVVVAHGGYVYRIAIMGEFGPDMLASFAFTS